MYSHRAYLLTRRAKTFFAATHSDIIPCCFQCEIVAQYQKRGLVLYRPRPLTKDFQPRTKITWGINGIASAEGTSFGVGLSTEVNAIS